jgi:hypothetical protein
MISLRRNSKEDYIWEHELQMARGFRTKIDPFTWNLERHSIWPLEQPKLARQPRFFAALKHDIIGIRLASEGVTAVKCRDTKCDAKCDRCNGRYATWLAGTWFAYEPCFLGRPRRGKIENCPSPSSLRNQALRRNDIPGYMTRESRNTLYSTISAFQATTRGFISVNLFDTGYFEANWTS